MKTESQIRQFCRWLWDTNIYFLKRVPGSFWAWLKHAIRITLLSILILLASLYIGCRAVKSMIEQENRD